MNFQVTTPLPVTPSSHHCILKVSSDPNSFPREPSLLQGGRKRSREGPATLCPPTPSPTHSLSSFNQIHLLLSVFHRVSL